MQSTQQWRMVNVESITQYLLSIVMVLDISQKPTLLYNTQQLILGIVSTVFVFGAAIRCYPQLGMYSLSIM